MSIELRDRIERRPIDSLVPYARNSRTHSDEQIQQLVESMRSWGWTNPVLVDERGGIIAGHGRVMAAQRLGLDEVPVIVACGWTNDQKRAYVIADNKLALNAGWDDAVLSTELTALRDHGFDLDLIGFSADELADLLGDGDDDNDSDPDAQPDPPDMPVSRIGDLWQLGEHRVLCGDSTSAADGETLLAGGSWDVCVFDPPYEVESLYADAMPSASPDKKLLVFWDFKRFAIAGHAAIERGWVPQYELIWDNVTSWYTPNRPLARHKACGVFGDDPRWRFDDAIIRDGKTREAKRVSNTRGEYEYTPLEGAVHLRTVEAFPTTAESGGHAHSKPIAWIEAIFNGLGGNVYFDAFAGSGSTLIACEKTGRIARLMELDPRYVDVIVRRWQEFAGGIAILADTGQTFGQVAAQRGVPEI